MNESTKKELLVLFENDEELFNQTIEELDSYNGYLGDNRYYLMDELPELFNGYNAIDLLNRAYFGRDNDSWHTNSHGEKEYYSFNPNREYFTFNGYGNLISSNYKDYSVYLDEYFIENLIENQNYLYLDTEIIKLLEA